MQAAKSPSNAPSHASAVPNLLAALGAIAHCRPDTFEEHLETKEMINPLLKHPCQSTFPPPFF